MMKRLLLALAVYLAASPAPAQQVLPPGQIDASGNLKLGPVTLGKRQSGKLTITPDTLQILGSGSTGDASGLSVLLSNGFTARSLADRFTLIRTPEDFGAIADGQSHPLSTRFPTLAAAKVLYPFVTSLAQEIDWAAAQAAVNAASQVSFSARDYVFNDVLTTADRAVTYKTQGIQQTRIICTAKPCGIRHTDNRLGGASANQRGTFTMKDGVTFITKIADGGTALSIDMRNQIANPATAVYGGPSALDVASIQAIGDDDFVGQGRHYWTTGVELIDTGTVSIPDLNVMGAFTKSGTTAVKILNITGANTEFWFPRAKIKYMETAFSIDAGTRTFEGLYIYGPSIVGSRYAFDLKGVIHSIDIAGGHIDANDSVLRAAASSRNSGAWFVRGNYLQLSNQYLGSFSSGARLFDVDGVVHMKVVNNHIVSFETGTKTQIGFSGAGTSKSLIDGNSWIGFAKATAWPANAAGTLATRNRVTGSNIYENTTAISDEPVSGSTNYIERSGTGWAERVNGEEIRFGTVKVTLDASGAGVVAFTKQLKGMPDIIKITNAAFTPAAANPAAFIYNAAGVSRESFVVAVVPNPGAVTVTLSYEAVARAATPQ
ncbi:hypothetical protein [Methylorubrum extorquens]|uniref:hypothetical protein n=1 Tax=Methylorubrum extorquens TaxID=408 RepID=UPI00223785E2|nr:hypothetical protein [Methylorubrum extorquens]UYW30152.1 hypothetical protein OKB92_14025 [Methylorubrum extorquens]